MTQQFPEDWGGIKAISRCNLRRETWRSLPHEWKRIYRFHGLFAMVRCLIGTKRLMNLEFTERNDNGILDCLTFTIIPEISILWKTFLMNALGEQNKSVLIGDSSGKFPKNSTDIIQVLPIFNLNHGTKLDLFMQKVCHAEYVLVCDDDIFWMDDEPLKYALKRFSDNNNLAVLSLQPRPERHSQLAEYVGQPMGSYCLIIKRAIWLKEKLSFRYFKPDGQQKPIYYFDTADYANLWLVQNGYEVEIAPEEIREHLVTFYGTSMWGIKILACQGDVLKIINPTRPDEHKKILRTALALKGFHDLLSTLSPNSKCLINREYLDRAEIFAKKELDKHTIQEVEGDIYLKLNRMKTLLQRLGGEK